MRVALLALAAVAAIVGGLAVFGPSVEAQDAEPTPVLRPVKLITLETESAWPTRRFFGRVVARSTVDLAFQVGGEIHLFGVQEGDRLPQGATLARLDLEPFELTLRAAELTREQAARAYFRLAELGPQTASQASIDDAETARELAIVQQREAERALRNATLKAPFDLLVARRYVDAFTTVAAGQQVIRIHDMSELRVEIDVPEILFRQAQGPDDFVLYATLVGDAARYPLEAREFNAETSDIGQSFAITLAFTGAVDPRVLPGATVTVTAEPATRLEALYIPQSAIVVSDGATNVMVFEPRPSSERDPDDGDQEEIGVVREVAVEIDTSGGGARIRAVSGLEPGVRIVAAGAALLEDGQTVRVYKGFEQ